MESDFLNGNPIEFLHQNHPNDSINYLLCDEDEEDAKETLEFLFLEQSLQQENDEEPLFNILRKQVEEISMSEQQQQPPPPPDNLSSETNANQHHNDDQIVLRTKKKISFDENSYANETKSSQLTNQQEVKVNRPLTIYIPNTNQDLNLLTHLASLGHDIDSFKQHVQLLPTICLGYLMKECSSSENNWRKRFFSFDRSSKLFYYFKSMKHYHDQKKPRDVVCFEDIKNVFPDHIRNVEKLSKYANFSSLSRKFKGRNIFIVKTNRKDFVLSASSPELMRLWIDVIFTGAEAYENYF